MISAIVEMHTGKKIVECDEIESALWKILDAFEDACRGLKEYENIASPAVLLTSSCKFLRDLASKEVKK